MITRTVCWILNVGRPPFGTSNKLHIRKLANLLNGPLPLLIPSISAMFTWKQFTLFCGVEASELHKNPLLLKAPGYEYSHTKSFRISNRLLALLRCQRIQSTLFRWIKKHHWCIVKEFIYHHHLLRCRYYIFHSKGIINQSEKARNLYPFFDSVLNAEQQLHRLTTAGFLVVTLWPSPFSPFCTLHSKPLTSRWGG